MTEGNDITNPVKVAATARPGNVVQIAQGDDNGIGLMFGKCRGNGNMEIWFDKN